MSGERSKRKLFVGRHANVGPIAKPFVVPLRPGASPPLRYCISMPTSSFSSGKRTGTSTLCAKPALVLPPAAKFAVNEDVHCPLACGQPHFDFLPEKLSQQTVAEDVAFATVSFTI